MALPGNPCTVTPSVVSSARSIEAADERRPKTTTAACPGARPSRLNLAEEITAREVSPEVEEEARIQAEEQADDGTGLASE